MHFFYFYFYFYFSKRKEKKSKENNKDQPICNPNEKSFSFFWHAIYEFQAIFEFLRYNRIHFKRDQRKLKVRE